MNRYTPLTRTAMAALLAMAAAAPALAQTDPVAELREEVRKLRAELEALKKDRAAAPAAKPADSSGWGERIEQLELKSKDAVTLGDIGGGFRLPGSETSIRLYGYAEAHAIHDIKAWSGSDNFTDLTFQGASGPKGRTKFTAETSRFGFETSTPTGLGTFNTKLEMDFYSYGSGNRNRLRLRHAYGEYAGFLIGQTWSTFMDLDDLPETVDFNGPIGAPFSRRTMIRYTYGMPQSGAKLTFALEDPQDQFGGGSANERMPQIVARFDKSFDWGAVNVRGLAHEKRSESQSKRGYGFGIGGSYKLTDKDLLMAQYTEVEGDIDQLYGSNGYTVDNTTYNADGSVDHAGTGAVAFDKNRGLVLGFAKTFSDQLRGTVAFGMNKGRTAQAVDNRRLTQWHFNLIYSPIKNVELGGELVLGERKTFAGDVAKMQRIDLMGRYSF